MPPLGFKPVNLKTAVDKSGLLSVSYSLSVIPAWFKPESSVFGFIIIMKNLDSR